MYVCICTPFCPYASFRFGNRHRVIPTQHILELKTNKIFKQPEMHFTPEYRIGQIETQHPKIRCKRDRNGISALFTAYLQIKKIDFFISNTTVLTRHLLKSIKTNISCIFKDEFRMSRCRNWMQQQHQRLWLNCIMIIISARNILQFRIECHVRSFISIQLENQTLQNCVKSTFYGH